MINRKYLFMFLMMATFIFPLNAQISKTIYVTIPGSLNRLLTLKELKTVTDLTLIGKIDQNDFETMRDSMPQLANLDLKAVTVVSNNINLLANTIPNYAFCSNDGNFIGKVSLKSIKLPSKLTSIEFGAFSGCSALKSITFPSTLTNIGNYAFDSCISLTDVVFPAALSNIGDGAFYGCSGLTNITLPDSLSTLGDGSFYGCNVTSCYINAKIPPIISSNSLDKKVVAVYVPEGAAESYQSAYFWKSRAIVEGEGNTLYLNIKKGGTLATEIFAAGFAPDKVNTLILEGKLNNDDFYIIKNHMPNLISINLSAAKISAIPDSLFINKRLLNIDLPASLISIGDYAFKFCKGLTNITFPVTLTAIGKEAFANCCCLTNITLPARIATINSSAFKDCCALSEIINFSSSPQKISADVWDNVNRKLCKLIVPEKSSTAYMTSKVWRDFSKINELAIQNEYVVNIKRNNGGVVLCDDSKLLNGQQITVTAGQMLTFEIAPKEGYYIGKVIYDNEDVTKLLQDGRFKTHSVNSSSTLSVLFVKKLKIELV